MCIVSTQSTKGLAAMTTRSTCNATKASKRVSFAKVEMHQYETALEGEKHISQTEAQGPVLGAVLITRARIPMNQSPE